LIFRMCTFKIVKLKNFEYNLKISKIKVVAEI
jgi:hypothetical protein